MMNIEIHVHAHFHGPAPESFTYRVDAASLRADILSAGYIPAPQAPSAQSDPPAESESPDTPPAMVDETLEERKRRQGAIRQQNLRNRRKESRNAERYESVTPGVTHNAVTEERERVLNNNNINNIKNNSLSLTVEPSTCEIKPHNANVTPTVTRNAPASPRTVARRAAPAKEPPETDQTYFAFDREPLPDVLLGDAGFAYLWEMYIHRRPVWKSDISEEMHHAVVRQLAITATRAGMAEARRMLAYGIEKKRFMTLLAVPDEWRMPDSLRPPAERGPVTTVTPPPIKDDPADRPADPRRLAEFQLTQLARGIDPETFTRIPPEVARQRKDDILKTLAMSAKEK